MDKNVLKGLLAEFKYFINANNSIISDIINDYYLSHNDYTIFYQISYNEGITQYDLAKKLKFTTQRLNQIVKSLEDEGYIKKVEAEGALLKKGLYITEKGRKTIEEISEKIYNVTIEILSKEEIEDLEIINRLLTRINKLLRTRIK